MPPHRAIPERPSDDEPPPFLGTWGRVYSAVLIYLSLLIAILVIATRTLSDW